MITLNSFTKSGEDPQPSRPLEIFVGFVLFAHKIVSNIFDKTNASRFHRTPN